VTRTPSTMLSLGTQAPDFRLPDTAAGGIAPVVATYTAVLLADTAVPAWHAGSRPSPGAIPRSHPEAPS